MTTQRHPAGSFGLHPQDDNESCHPERSEGSSMTRCRGQRGVRKRSRAHERRTKDGAAGARRMDAGWPVHPASVADQILRPAASG